MRVAVVTRRTAHHGETDAAGRLCRLAELLAGRGHDVTVFCRPFWDVEGREETVDGVTYRAVADDPEEPTWRFAAQLPARLRPFEPDVIHAEGASSAVVVWAKVAGAVLRRPLLVDWYDHVPAEEQRLRGRRLAVRLPDRVVTPSRLVQTDVRELGRPSSGILVIPNGIEMDLIRRTEPDPIADIVYSRQLDGDANLESLLLALAELRDTSWKAAVIGDGPLRQRYEEHAAELRIADRVRFIGDQPVERRIAAFRGAHVCVHTATRASFATDFLRALACGCVGIAEYHAASSAHELVERRSRGIRTTTGDELDDAIRRAASLPRRDIDESFADFGEPRFLERYLDCYRQLLADRGLL